MSFWFEQSLPEVEFILERLKKIVPGNVDNALFARNITAARTVFVMLYSYAVEGQGPKIRPSTVTVMTDKQSMIHSRVARESWLKQMQGAKKPNLPDRWYSENTREPIRDDTISTLKQIGAVEEEAGIPTTSSKPRYYLAQDFAGLLDPTLQGEELELALNKWRATHLTKGALILQGLKEQERRSEIIVEYGETKHKLAPGPSSILTKAAVEVFAKKFLEKPEVLLISESADKIHANFGKVLDSLKITINLKKALPDVLIAETSAKGFRLVFIEIVHTDGPISNDRMRKLLELAKENDLNENECAFVTVFASRSDPAYRKVQSSIAWGSFVWFADEPERIIHLIDTKPDQNITLVDLLNV